VRWATPTGAFDNPHSDATYEAAGLVAVADRDHNATRFLRLADGADLGTLDCPARTTWRLPPLVECLSIEQMRCGRTPTNHIIMQIALLFDIKISLCHETNGNSRHPVLII
jgi:hypothetical protein